MFKLCRRKHPEHGAAELRAAAELRDHGDGLRLRTEELGAERGRVHRRQARLQIRLARYEPAERHLEPLLLLECRIKRVVSK